MWTCLPATLTLPTNISVNLEPPSSQLANDLLSGWAIPVECWFMLEFLDLLMKLHRAGRCLHRGNSSRFSSMEVGSKDLPAVG